MMPSSVAPDASRARLCACATVVVAGESRNAACPWKYRLREVLERGAALAQRLLRSASCPSASTSRSNTISRAGVSAASCLHAARGRVDALQQRRRTRTPPSAGTTISPSSTNVLGLQRSQRLRPARENTASAAGRTWIAARPCAPSRNARQRKPSHFGSYCQSVAGRDFVDRQALPSAQMADAMQKSPRSTFDRPARVCAGGGRGFIHLTRHVIDRHVINRNSWERDSDMTISHTSRPRASRSAPRPAIDRGSSGGRRRVPKPRLVGGLTAGPPVSVPSAGQVRRPRAATTRPEGGRWPPKVSRTSPRWWRVRARRPRSTARQSAPAPGLDP